MAKRHDTQVIIKNSTKKLHGTNSKLTEKLGWVGEIRFYVSRHKGENAKQILEKGVKG